MYFIIYDFETSGLQPRFDQILQGGFICYDQDLNEISRLNIRSRINSDLVPSFGALKVTKLLLSDLLKEKNSHYEMFIKISDYIESYKPAVFIGYNSIHFDEEFLRQSLWEVFKYPYTTSSKENYRGDVYGLTTMVHAFDPKVIKVGLNEDGKKNFKLESLAKINSFKIESSHEAISDVIATKEVMKLIKNKSNKLFKTFFDNTDITKLSKKIKENELFSMHAYYYSNHRVYLLTHLTDHPIYNNYSLSFDLRYNPLDFIKLNLNELKDIFFKKKIKPFRKIKLKKQPSILDFSYALKFNPYHDNEENFYRERCLHLRDELFLENIKKILESEAESFEENKSQELSFEEETIYTKNVDFRDKVIMSEFQLVGWQEKWNFATKFKDPRLRFFAAKHIYRNFPEFLPLKVFKFFHKKMSERFNSLKKEKFTTFPSAFEEADTFSLEIEENGATEFEKKQLDQYNIYINFLNDYYNNPNAKPVKFNSDLSAKLFN